MASTVVNKGETEAVAATSASSFFVASPSHLNSSVISEESFIQKLNLQYISSNESTQNDAFISLEKQFPMCLDKIQGNPNLCTDTILTNDTRPVVDSHMASHEKYEEIISDESVTELNEQNKETTTSQDLKHLSCIPQEMDPLKKGTDNTSALKEVASVSLSQETLRKRYSRSENGSYKRIHTMTSKYPRRYKDKAYSKVTLPSRVGCCNDSSDQDVSKDLRFELLPLPTVVKPSPIPCESKDSCYDLNDMFQLPEKKTHPILKKSSFQTFPICEVIRLVAEALEVPLHHVEELFNETCPLTSGPPTFKILSGNKPSSFTEKENFQSDFQSLDTQSSRPENICKQQSTFLSSLPSHTNFLKDEYTTTTKPVHQLTNVSTSPPFALSSETFSTNSYVSPLASYPYTVCNKKDKLNNLILPNPRSMKGVSFDRSKRNWEASWLDAHTGKRVKKCFSEGRWGSSARDMAILARRKAEQSGIISTRQQFQNSSNVLTDPESETPASLSPRITLGKPTTFSLDPNATTQDDLLQQIASRVTKTILFQNKKNTF